jgi:phosphotransferase system HPr (HPr) family protein
LHLRPATAFAKLARQYESKITLHRDDRVVNGKSQVELILLAAEPGAQVILEVDGPDADAALPVLADLLGRPSCDDESD